MARLLVTSVPEGSAELKRILGNSHVLVYAKTVHEAIALCKEKPPEAILCGLLFDDSRMFDFLRACKADPDLSNIPFVCCRVVEDVFPKAVIDALEIAAKAVGAYMFLDVNALKERGMEDQVLFFVNECLRV
jgi:hypothetical protein